MKKYSIMLIISCFFISNFIALGNCDTECYDSIYSGIYAFTTKNISMYSEIIKPYDLGSNEYVRNIELYSVTLDFLIHGNGNPDHNPTYLNVTYDIIKRDIIMYHYTHKFLYEQTTPWFVCSFSVDIPFNWIENYVTFDIYFVNITLKSDYYEGYDITIYKELCYTYDVINNIISVLSERILPIIPIISIMFVISIVLFEYMGKNGFIIGLIASTILLFFSELISIQLMILMLLCEFLIIIYLIKRNRVNDNYESEKIEI